MASSTVQTCAAPTAKPDAEAEFDEIIYHITHDVRASLRAMRLLPAWLREDLEQLGLSIEGSVAETLDMMEAQAARADRLLVDLRTYSRIGRLADDPVSVPLDDVVSEALAREPVPGAFRLAVLIDVPRLRASRNELVELFAALISNAVKHHEGGAGAIEVSVLRVQDGVAIAVQDDGPGIPEAFRDRVFSMMTTLRSRDECEGSGLGLAIVRKIVERLGGTVRILDGAGGRGTRIEAHLPAELARH